MHNVDDTMSQQGSDHVTLLYQRTPDCGSDNHERHISSLSFFTQPVAWLAVQQRS